MTELNAQRVVELFERFTGYPLDGTTAKQAQELEEIQGFLEGYSRWAFSSVNTLVGLGSLVAVNNLPCT